MGTRHLTVVIKDNEIKLSQYGQWDGYFKGQGQNFVNFVRNNLRKKLQLEWFKGKIDLLKPVNEEYYNMLVEKYKEMNANKEFRLPFSVVLPQFSRDTGTNILNLIDSLHSYELDNKRFPVYIEKDVDWCEFAYVINLDTEEVYLLTTWDFNIPEVETCELVRQNYKNFKCWYKNSIKKLDSAKAISRFNQLIKLEE